MAYFLQVAVITSALLLSSIPGIYSFVLYMDVYNYTSPPIGSRVDFQCYGPAIQQRGGDEYFDNGGRLVWLLDDVVIANASTTHQYSIDSNRYSLKSWNVAVHGTSNSYFALTINRVTDDDNGEYQCALFSDEKDMDISSLPKTLVVQYPPSKLYPQCLVDSIQVDSNSVTLRCRSETAYPPVNLYWTSSDVVVGDASPTISGRYTETTVDVAVPVTSAEYVCKANYSGDFKELKVIRECKLKTPVISLDPAVEVIEGGEARFTCSVSAAPESEQGVLWTAVPPLTAKNTTISLNDKNSVSVLTVRNVTARENGTAIWCHCQNLLGESHQRSVMTVRIFGSPPGTYIPPIRVKIEPQIAELMAGETATFTCDVSTISSSYTYKWYYQEQEINSDSENTKFWIDQRRLRISEVKITDSYSSIACVVSAGGHTVTARATLHVLSPSTIPSPVVGKVSNTDSPDFISEYGTLIGLISGGLVSIALIILLIWLAITSKRKCTRKQRNQHQVHTINDAVSYSASIGGINSFNNVFNESRPVSPSTDMTSPFGQSTFSSSGPNSTNNQPGNQRLVVNLPPVPPIPLEGAVGEGDTLRAAKKLAQLEDYETMETIQSNFYSSMTSDGNNQYQHSIGGLFRSNSRPNAGPLNTDGGLLPGQILNMPEVNDGPPNTDADLLPGQRLNLPQANDSPDNTDAYFINEQKINKPEPLY